MESHLIQGTSAWLEMRKKFVTGSDAPIVMGESPFKTALQLWEEKVGIKNHTFVSSAMKRGTDLEAAAREAAEKDLGIKFSPVVVFHEFHRFMMCSLDGLSDDGKTILEIKCPNPTGEDHQLASEGIIPRKYYGQLQHALECVAKARKLIYYSFDGEKGAIVEVKMDNQYVEEMLCKEREFYKCMQQFVPPTFHLDDYVEMTDPRWEAFSQAYLSARKKSDQFGSDAEMFKQKLIELSGGLNAYGGGIRLSKSYRKGNIEYAAIEELKQIDLEKYRKPPSEYWRVTA